MIALGFLIATLFAAVSMGNRTENHVYTTYRRHLGRSILLGFKFLVAGDVIRTVAVTPTFYSVGVLGLIVLIRTFLSFSLERELALKTTALDTEPSPRDTPAPSPPAP